MQGRSFPVDMVRLLKPRGHERPTPSSPLYNVECPFTITTIGVVKRAGLDQYAGAKHDAKEVVRGFHTPKGK